LKSEEVFRVKSHRSRVLVSLVVTLVALSLAGCSSFGFVITGQSRAVPPALSPAYRNGQEAIVTGRVVVERNAIMLEDRATPAVFRFVGLRPAEKKALADLAGQVTRVRLRVMSTQSAKAFNAQLMEFSSGG
jgi:hypothetical protein